MKRVRGIDIDIEIWNKEEKIIDCSFIGFLIVGFVYFFSFGLLRENFGDIFVRFSRLI